MLDVTFFRGSRPKIEPHLLELGEASRAVNCRLQTGGLMPFRGNTQIQAASVGGVETIAKYGDTAFWFEFTNQVDVVNGPIQDTESPVYFTGDGVPAMTYASIATTGLGPYPTNRYRLGIPAPTVAPTAAVTGVATGGDDTEDSRVYVMTYVSARGEEGPPSDPSAIARVLEGQSVNLTNLAVAPAGNYNVTKKRIYRTSSASGDTAYQFVTELDVAVTSHSDTLETEFLGGVLPSLDWQMPPDGMIGLIDADNGVMAGFEGKKLYLSEPYQPHAWPYSLTMNDEIVGLVNIRGGIVVFTKGRPASVSFTNPAAAAKINVESPRACVSKRSIVDMGEFGVAASADGLMAVDGAGNERLITASVIDKYQWQTFNPETIHAYRLENWYVGFYQGDSGDAGFAIAVDGSAYVELDFYADDGFVDQDTGGLYLLIDGNIVKWDDNAASVLSYLWRSGTVLLPGPKNMACARVDAEAYPVTFKLFNEDTGAEIHSQLVGSDNPFWLPDNVLVRRYSVELSGNQTIRRVQVSDSMEGVL